jgi:hypothetical protein
VRTRGWVRTADISPVPGAAEQLSVELHMTDASNMEQYCRWKSVHFAGGRPASQVDIKHGDDIEIFLVTMVRGVRGLPAHNHTRNSATLCRGESGLYPCCPSLPPALLCRCPSPWPQLGVSVVGPSPHLAPYRHSEGSPSHPH